MRTAIILACVIIVIAGGALAFFYLRSGGVAVVQTGTIKYQKGEEAAPPEGPADEDGQEPDPVPQPSGKDGTGGVKPSPPLALHDGVFHPLVGLLPEGASPALERVKPAIDPEAERARMKERNEIIEEHRKKREEKEREELKQFVKVLPSLEKDEARLKKLKVHFYGFYSERYRRFRTLKSKGDDRSRAEIYREVLNEFIAGLENILEPEDARKFAEHWKKLEPR
jgi:hypothetical protein